jgi:hypothetical protein
MISDKSLEKSDLLYLYLKEAIILKEWSFDTDRATGGAPITQGQQEKLNKAIKEKYVSGDYKLSNQEKRILNLCKLIISILDPTPISAGFEIKNALNVYNEKSTYINFIKLLWASTALIPVLGKLDKIKKTITSISHLQKFEKACKAIGNAHNTVDLYSAYLEDESLKKNLEDTKKAVKNSKNKNLIKSINNIDKKINKANRAKIIKQANIALDNKIEEKTPSKKEIDNEKTSKSKSTSVKQSISNDLKKSIPENLIDNHKKSITLYRTKKKKIPYIKSVRNMKKIISRYVKDKKAVNKIVHQNNWKRSNEKIINRIIRRTEYFAAKKA